MKGPIRFREDWSRFNHGVLLEAGVDPKDSPGARLRRAGAFAVYLVGPALAILLLVTAWKRMQESPPPVTARLDSPGVVLPPPAAGFPPLRLDAAPPTAPPRVDPDDLARVGRAVAAPPVLPAAPAPAGAERIVTDYTVFHSVGHGRLLVVTGWRYASSTDRRPTNQHCYLEESLPSGLSRISDFGGGGSSVARTPYREDRALGLAPWEWEEAFRKCRWFPGTAVIP